MTGTSRRSTSSRPSKGANVVVALAVAALLALSASPAAAQSGRNRARPAPAPQPQPQPQPGPQPAAPDSAAPTAPEPAPPPAPIPQGGLVAKQDNGGAVTRYALRNGLILVVRENPASQLVAVRLALRGADAASVRSATLATRPDGSVAERLRALGATLDVEPEAGRAAAVVVAPWTAAETAAASLAPMLDGPTRPESATLVVDGRVIPFNVLVAVQRAYGAVVPPPENPAPPPPTPPAVESEAYVSTRDDVGLARVRVAYAAPEVRAADAPAVDVAAAALGDGLASRLGRALRMTGLVASVTSTRGVDEVAFEIAADPRQLDAAESAFFREVDRFRRERISEGELQRARSVFERRFLARSATVEGEARELDRFEAQTGDVRALASYPDRVRSVKAADVQRVAARTFSAVNARVAEVLPPDAPARTFTPKAFAETIVAWAPTAAREVAPGDVRTVEGPAAVPEGPERHRQPEREDAVVFPVPLAVRDFSTLNGPKAFVREDQSRSLISIGFFYAGGRAAEAAGDRGITELMLRSMVRGSRKYPDDKLAQALEQLGAEVRVVSDVDFFGLVVEAPSRNAQQVFPIAIDMVARPAFEKEAVARERDVLLAAQRLARADAAERSVELFWQSRYPTHAYGAPTLGQPETVAKLDDEKVRDWYARTAGTTFPLVAIVGDTDGSSLISRFVAEGFDRGEGTPAPTPGLPAPAAAGEAIEPRDRAGTTQTLGFPVQGGAAAALDALDVAIAAAGARALAELGDRLGIATVRATVERRRLAGAARVTAASSTADETRVRDAVAAKLSEVAGAALSDAELDSARGLAVTSTLDARQSFTDMVVVYVRSAALGTPLDTVENYAERSSAITAESVRKAAAAFNPQLAGRGVARGR